METVRRLVMSALVLVSSACATPSSTPQAPPGADVTGTWTGTWEGTGTQAGTVTLRLQQTESRVRGNQSISGEPRCSGPVEGNVAGNELSLQLVGEGFIGITLTVKGNEMTGYAPVTGTRWRLKRQE